MTTSESYALLHTRIHALTLDDLNRAVTEAIDAGRHMVIANHNLNSLNLHHRDASMAEFYRQAEIIHVDGMGVIALARFLGLPFQRHHRVTYVDWMPELMRLAAERGWRVFYLGSAPGVAARGVERLRASLPSLSIETHHGYFETGSMEERYVLAAIEAFAPHILMVGMGMPRQERWILANRDRVAANIILPSGACMDYVAGAVPTPPRWMGRVGLEWLFRLLAEPRRLWRRYLIEPWLLARLVAIELRTR